MWKNLLLVTLLASSSVCMAAAKPAAVGGYTTAQTDSQEVKNAADFAATQINKGKLVKIISAKSQVVAGMNYVLVLELENADGKHVQYGARVFVPLPASNQPMQLVKFNEIKKGNTSVPKHDPEYTAPVEPDSELFTD